MDGSMFLQNCHLLYCLFAPDCFESFVGRFSEIAHVEPFIPRVGAVAHCITASLFLFRHCPTAGARHSDNTLRFKYNFPYLFDGKYLSEMLSLSLFLQCANYTGWQASLLHEKSFQTPEGPETFPHSGKVELFNELPTLYK